MHSNFALQSIKFILIAVTASAFIPFEFFPEKVQAVIRILPFQYLFYWPIQCFLNRGQRREFAAFARTIGIEILWLAILYLVCRLGWRLSVRRFCAEGFVLFAFSLVLWKTQLREYVSAGG